MAAGESGKMAVAECGQADISGGVDKSNKDIDISNKDKVNVNTVDAAVANSHALGTNIGNIGVENKGEDNQ